ncbi:MAG: flavodoxin family protein [Bacteroidales bacterium]|nr:flavodoxin family protein [Bacteroidales bacterium]
MKVLMINGSPKGKRSNTYKLSVSFVEGVKVNNEIEYEEVQVNNLNIKPCLGCFSCWNKTPGHCVIKDEMDYVLEKILWADRVCQVKCVNYFLSISDVQ